MMEIHTSEEHLAALRTKSGQLSSGEVGKLNISEATYSIMKD
jgi:hypothetical protein